MNFLYIVSKLFTYLILPPGIFIIMLLFAAFYAKKFKTFFLFFAFSFYLLSNSFVADFLLYPLAAPYNKHLQVTKSVNAVIVLGGGNLVGSANLPLSSDAFKRVMWGLMIAKSQNLPLVFSSGGLYKKYTESAAFLDTIKELQNSLGLDMPLSKNLTLEKFSISTEDKSLDTYQNAKFSKEKFEKLGVTKPIIYLVTSAYHMKRAEILYKYFGFKVIPAATDFKTSNEPKTNWSYLPNIKSFDKSYIALHEYFGLLSLKLRRII